MEGAAKLNALLLLIRGDNLGHPRSGVWFACINGRSVPALHIGQGLRADIGTSRAEPGDHIADIFIGPAAPAIGTAYAVLGTKGKAASDLTAYPTLYGQYMFIINGKRTFKVNKDKRSQGMSVRAVRDI